MHRARWLVVLPLLSLPAPAPAQVPDDRNPSYESVHTALRGMALRPDRVARVDHFILRRDAAEFRLEGGTLQLLTPVGGRTIGAVFTGTGTLNFTPPLKVERAELVRILHDSVLSSPITAVVFVFTDSTASELEGRLSFGPGPGASGASDPVTAALEFLTGKSPVSVQPTLLAGLLNQESNGFFAGYVIRPRGEDLMVQVDPQQVEQILLQRRAPFRPHQGRPVQTIAQFPRSEDLRDSISAADRRPDPLELRAYRIEATIEEHLHFSAVATVQLRGRRDGTRWARFFLHSNLELDSVTNLAGARLSYYRPKQSPELWVRFDAVIDRDSLASFRVAYHGEKLFSWGPLFRMGKWAYLESPGEWFPRYGEREQAAMEFTFHTPSQYGFVSVGQLVESRVDGQVRTSKWVTEAPTDQASFNIGEFQEFEITDPRIPPVTVQLNEKAHRDLATLLPAGHRDPKEQVGADVANSLAFFSEVYGPPRFKHYYATEIPYLHGQAFPGMIHLSWQTFMSAADSGEDEIFRAHEMAHQWWGIGVEPAGYRDAWLAEGLAEFSGWWYMQAILLDNAKYFKQLRESAKQLRQARDDAPPMGLGYRLGQLDPAHYTVLVYRKGAWIAHMLRNLLLDFQTMNEDRFRATMRDFYTRYLGKAATTRDFQRVVERHIGAPMDWFFNEWVNGTAIPTYTLSWKVEPSVGKQLLRYRVRQDHVPDDFIMPVPLLIVFADSTRMVTWVGVSGHQVEGELTLPSRPARLELNYLQSVLAEVNEEHWR